MSSTCLCVESFPGQHAEGGGTQVTRKIGGPAPQVDAHPCPRKDSLFVLAATGCGPPSPVLSQTAGRFFADAVSSRLSQSLPNRLVTLNSPPQVHMALTVLGASEFGKNARQRYDQVVCDNN